MADVSRETIPLTQRILLIYLLCFMWNMGNACKGNLLRLRLCFEAYFMDVICEQDMYGCDPSYPLPNAIKVREYLASIGLGVK